MATCNRNDLLESGKCFAALPEAIQQALALSLWCDISTNIGPIPPSSIPSWVNPDLGDAPIFDPDANGVVINPDV